jgi:hypothetical protein
VINGTIASVDLTGEINDYPGIATSIHDANILGHGGLNHDVGQRGKRMMR